MSQISSLVLLLMMAIMRVKMIYSTFIILIVITISITIIIIISIIIIIVIITSIIAIIINSTKDDIWDMDELLHKLTNFGEQGSKPC